MFRVVRVGGLCTNNSPLVLKWKEASKTSSLACLRLKRFCHSKKETEPVHGHTLVEEAIEYSIHGPSAHLIHDTYADVELTDVNNLTKSKKHANVKTPENVSPYISQGKINLHGCMQTNVPEPYRTEMSQNLQDSSATNSNSVPSNLGHGDPKNMPGSGKKLLQKYISGGQNDVRSFHSTCIAYMQAAELYPDDENYITNVFPQGIQGDQCAQYKLWMENCLRYGLPNCDEQLESVMTGRKTLPQIFAEQEELIKSIAMRYKQKHVDVLGLNRIEISDVNGLDLQMEDMSSELRSTCPEGIQGDECVNFDLWVENSNRFELKYCEDHIQGVQADMKNFAEDGVVKSNFIHPAVSHFGKTSRRSYSTSTADKESSEKEVGKAPSASNNSDIEDPSSQSQNTDPPPETQLSQRARLKKAVKEYGGTVIVFHVGISLISLGGFYLLVSSGVDVIGLLVKAGIGEEFFQSKIAAGASTFVIAYAAHKVFAPVRIGITLTSTPLIVKYLRQRGILKPPAKKKGE